MLARNKSLLLNPIHQEPTMSLTKSAISFLIVVSLSSSALGETVFDNLTAPLNAGVWYNAQTDEMSAQPFGLGSNHSVSSVTLKLRRNGTPDGSYHVDIFDDSSGVPGASVGRIGSIDPLSITEVDGGADYVFDSPIGGLTPDQTYHVVVSHDGTTWTDANRVSWYMTMETGAAGAGEALAIQPPAVPDWNNVNGFPTGGPPFSVWHNTQVTAVPEPSGSMIFIIPAVIGLLRIRKRRTAVDNTNRLASP